MSYARFGEDSDVYVFQGSRGYFCCACMLNRDNPFDTPGEVLEHLAEHQAAGHKVPEHALERLKQEAQLKQEDDGE